MPAPARIPTVIGMQTLTHTTAVDIAAQVRAGRLSARTVVEASLARIAADDPRIGAFQAVDADGARRAADALAGRADLADLPLAGVPVAVKDNIDVAGLPTRHGSAATSPAPARVDDPLVVRLRAAGAVIVGKTRMPELAAWAFTESLAYGGTRNPRDPARNAGGSTGGGAAAVAAGMVALALGSDGGGSLRVPAAYCGVVGLKPGSGVPGLASGHWYGCTAYGPIAATVADAALALEVLGDVRQTASDTPLRFAASTRPASPIGPADAAAKAAVERVAALLGTVGRADLSYPPTLINQWARSWLAGIAREVEERGLDETRLEPRTRSMLARGRRLHRRGLPRPADAAAWRTRALDWFATTDVLITPVVARPAPRAGALQGTGYVRTYLAAARSISYTQPWNLAGLPALSLPVGGGTPRRPAAVQLVAADEATLLRAAALVERLAGERP